jgi:hypothetical protein
MHQANIESYPAGAYRRRTSTSARWASNSAMLVRSCVISLAVSRSNASSRLAAAEFGTAI